MEKKNKDKILLLLMICLLIITLSYSLEITKKEIKTITTKEIIYKTKIETSNYISYLNSNLDPIIVKTISESINKYSKKYNLSKKLILSVIWKESRFNVLATSPVAVGLMQIYPKFHKEKIGELKYNELFYIDNNIRIGCEILKEYMDKSKNELDEALHKYLSKTATKSKLEKYVNDIYRTISELDIYENN